MRVTPRSEKRRIRRGRQLSRQAGQGHGDRTYVPVRMTNVMATEAGRAARREELERRAIKRFEYLERLKRRVAKREAARGG